MNDEIIKSILDKFYLLKEMAELKQSDLIEIDVGSIQQPLLLYLLLELRSNKTFLVEFCEFLEEKAKTVNNPYELKKVNEFLELKPLINTLNLENLTESKEELENICGVLFNE